MNHEQFEIKLESLGYFGCGLNNNWNCQAWCLSTGHANRHNFETGGIYLLDKEKDVEDGHDCENAYEVVQRFYENDGYNDQVDLLIEFETAEKALEWIQLLESIKTWDFPYFYMLIDTIAITDPTMSECGRFEVDEFYHLDQIVENCQLAFWEEVTKHFPTIKNGDFPPEESYTFQQACFRAVKLWVDANRY
jgi:hypothetical protein